MVGTVHDCSKLSEVRFRVSGVACAVQGSVVALWCGLGADMCVVDGACN